ncbi:MAG: EamA family transporter RarD [Bdellovibrionales bacterium]
MKLTKGHLQGFWAYVIWGVFPAYWKYLQHISPVETLYHRILWGCAFLGILVFVHKRSSPKVVFSLLQKNFFYVLLLAILIAANWYIYVYAVNTNQILQGSLAYFISPLLTIVMGAYFFGETLTTNMKAASVIAGLGVLVLILMSSGFPWIALSLSFSFAFYSVVKKKIHLGGLESSFLESFVLALPAIFLATQMRVQSTVPFSGTDWALLIGGGVVTSLPILLFSLSTRSIPFNHLGILQFLSPSLQFLVGFFIYDEPVAWTKWIAFVCVWMGAGLYLKEILSPWPRSQSKT